MVRRAALEEIRDGVAKNADPVQLATLELGLRIDSSVRRVLGRDRGAAAE